MQNKTFYRLLDEQCGTYMATGTNCTTLEELKDDILSWAEPGIDDPEDFQSLKKMSALELCEFFQFELEQSNTPFPENF